MSHAAGPLAGTQRYQQSRAVRSLSPCWFLFLQTYSTGRPKARPTLVDRSLRLRGDIGSVIGLVGAAKTDEVWWTSIVATITASCAYA